MSILTHGQASSRWMTLGDAVADCGATYGNATAVTFPGLGSLTYQEVDRQSLALARGLLARGVAKGDRVASLLVNSPEQLLLWLASGRIGAVAVPINISLQRNDLLHVIRETTPKAFVTDSEHLDRYLTLRADCTDTGGIELEILVGAEAASCDFTPFASLFHPEGTTFEGLPLVDPSDPACILFTGGTTGLPKGTLRSHFSYICSAQRYQEFFSPVQGDSHLSSTHLFHCGGQEIGFLGPFMSGIPTVIPAWFSASQYWTLVNEYHATILEILPATMEILLRAAPSPSDTENSARVGYGSGPRKAEFERRFGLRLLETYALTETGTLLVTNRPDDSREGSVGLPRDWCEVTIRGDRDESLPAGEIGEICIRPTLPYSMASGYFNRAEATVERWRNLWIHTGDLGRMDDDGWLYLVGRQAHWIRRRGENISVQEVEQALSEHPAIFEVAVVGVDSPLGEQDLEAFVALRPGHQIQPEDLRDWCQDRLAFFKIPEQFIFVDRLPRTAAKGEVERHKLSAQASVET